MSSLNQENENNVLECETYLINEALTLWSKAKYEMKSISHTLQIDNS